MSDTLNKKHGYHISKIKRGVYGTSSKLLEEVHEIMDAEEQNCKIMTLVELADLYAAMAGYIEQNFPTFTMEDIASMSDITQRAFRNGYRKPRDIP